MITSVLTLSIIVSCIFALIYVTNKASKKQDKEIKEFWAEKLKEAEEQEEAFKKYAEDYMKSKRNETSTKSGKKTSYEVEITPKKNQQKKTKSTTKSNRVDAKKMSSKPKTTKKSVKNEVH